jgi:hypothetical protein
MSDVDSVHQSYHRAFLKLEEPVNDLKNILGILVDLSSRWHDKAGDVTLTEGDVEQIVFMIMLGARTARDLRRFYYHGDEAA